MFYCLLSHGLIFGQSDNGLKKTITDFELNNKVKFNYSDNDIEKVGLKDLDIKDLDLESFLNIIEEQTILSVKKTNNNTYILYIDRKPFVFQGIVIDAFTKKALSGIQISDGAKSTYTNDNGEFEIETSVFSVLTISTFGYKMLTYKIDSPKQRNILKIELFEKHEELNEIVLISDYLTLGFNKRKDNSIQIIPSDLKLLPGLVEPDVMQSVQMLPGIYSASDSAADLNIRGSNADENLILWDGIKIYSTGHFFNQVSAFNPQIAESINVYKNGTSAKYGGRIAGVVDIKSTTKIPEKIEGSLGANLTNVDANLKIPIKKKTALILAARLSTFQLGDFNNYKLNNLKKKVFQNTTLDETEIDDSKFTSFENENKFYDVNAKLIIDLGKKGKIQFSNLFMENALNYKSTLENIIRTEDTTNIKNIGSSLDWKKQTKRGIEHHLSVYYTNYNYVFNSDAYFDEDLSNSKQLNTLEDIGGGYSIEIPIKKNSSILSGFQTAHNSVEYTEENDEETAFYELQNFRIKNKLNTYSLFTEFNYDTDGIQTKIGIRNNYIAALNTFFIEPRLNASFRVTDNLQINISAEQKNQVLRQSYKTLSTRFATIANAWIVAAAETEDTKEIPVAKSTQFSVGTSYNKKGFGFIVESFLKKNNGLVTLNNNVLTINDDLYFVGEGTIVGVDVLIKKKIKKYRTWLNYSLSQNLLFFPDISDSEFYSSIDASHILNWSHTLDFKKFEIGLSWNFRTGLPYSTPSSGELNANGEPGLIYKDQNNLRLPDYSTFNASLLYNLKLKNDIKLKLGVSVQNILNTKNILNREYQIRTINEDQEPKLIFDNIKVYELNSFSLPITPELLLRLSF